jgi:hypothetical protein
VTPLLGMGKPLPFFYSVLTDGPAPGDHGLHGGLGGLVSLDDLQQFHDRHRVEEVEAAHSILSFHVLKIFFKGSYLSVVCSVEPKSSIFGIVTVSLNLERKQNKEPEKTFLKD